MPPPRAFVYMVRCADGTFYTGYAVDLHRRLRAHNQGRGAKYTAGRRPVSLVYAAACRSKSEALKRERQIKRWPRDKKAELARRDIDLSGETSAPTRRQAVR
jgi:putative endonuclease